MSARVQYGRLTSANLSNWATPSNWATQWSL